MIRTSKCWSLIDLVDFVIIFQHIHAFVAIIISQTPILFLIIFKQFQLIVQLVKYVITTKSLLNFSYTFALIKIHKL